MLFRSTSTTNLTTQQLNVSGVSTHTGVSTFQSTLFGTQASFTGVVTANSYRGDGSQLTGLIPNTVATSSTTSPQYIGFLTASSGVTTNLQASSTLVYIPSSGNLGIGTTNPSNTLTVVGSGTSTSQLFVTGVSTFTGQFQSTQANSTTTGGGQIYLNGATGNRIDFNQNGVAAPAFTTRSAGTKLVLYPNISGTTVDYALGIENSTLWYSIDLANSTKQHRWYAGTTQLADLKGSGELVIGSTSLTGTASQALQVNSGAYVSGNLGIGTTNPQASLQVQGGANITGVTTIGVLNTSGTILNPTTAQSIVSIGQSALLNNTAINNVAVGQLALNTNTVGAYNVAIGVQALSKNTIGQYQVAVGYQALLTNTSGGYFNTALGAQTLLNNSTGYQNTAVGNFALAYNQTGINNVAVGAYALLNPTGSSNNNVIGFNALQAVGAGSSNNVFGTNALFNATGNYNVAIGESAGVGQTSGNFNVIIGASQNTPILTGSNQLVIGAGNTAWISGNSSYNVGIGTTNPTSKLYVVGDVLVSGVVTATTFSGNVSSATYAANAGIATNLKGGVIGNIPYQNAADTTVFLTNGVSGTILQSNGVGNAPSWVTAAPAGAITGLTIRDEGTIVGTANSVSQFNFVGSNITATASGVGATITISDNLVGTGLSISGISTLGITSVTNLTAQQLNVTGVGTFQSSNLKIRNPANTFEYSIVGSTIAANRNLTLPLLGADDTIATLGLASQTFTGTNTFSGSVSFSGNNVTINPTVAGGNFTLGNTAGTGNIVVGQSTATQQTDIQAGASGVGTTKTINLGTGGLSGSFTQINIGPTAGVGTITINSGTRLGIGTTVPVSALHVIGDIRVSGVVTATDFNSASDAKLKTNIQPIENALDKVVQIQGVSFNWIENNKPSMGVIADDLQKVLPELVSDTDPKTVNYNGLIGLLIEVVKEQQSRIQLLENRISKLE